MAVTKANVIACKRIKGGRAGCWIKGKKGKTVFRFVNPKKLSGLGITIVSAAQALKMLPAFAGSKSSSSRMSGGGVTFDGEHCRDKEGKFVPIRRCTGKATTPKRKPTKKKTTTRKRK